MEGPQTLIAAYADEDRQLQEVIRRFDPVQRNALHCAEDLTLVQTLGHLAFWDRYAVEFYEGRIAHRDVAPLTFDEFEARNRDELERLCGLPYERVRLAYVEATHRLLDFLRVHWEDLDDLERTNFTIPLKHRRHHRRLLLAVLEAAGSDSEAEAQNAV